MNILVTGAAGYIGSVVVQELIAQSNSVIAIDNLTLGHRGAVHPDATFIHADLADSEKLKAAFQRNSVDAVMHFAGLASVGESMSSPDKYFHNNLSCGINLLNAMLQFGVNKFIFSSSAAVYGDPASVPITETHPTLPVNPYGETKLIFEKILHWYHVCKGLNFVALRYFNASGAYGLCGEDHNPETHLIPNILKAALGQSDGIKIFGNDYPTPDGTCIRDYVHVFDIARAHILALKSLENSNVNQIFNLGNGSGYSVLEVINTAKRVCSIDIPIVNYPKRQGDPPILIAKSDQAKREMGWEPRYQELGSIIESAWQWQKEHPNGYEK